MPPVPHPHLQRPVQGAIDREDYARLVQSATFVLRGKTQELLANLKKEMEQRAGNQEFEQALILRDQIRALEHLRYRQDIARRKAGDEDIINYRATDGTVHLMLFNVYRGTLGNKNEFTFSSHPDFPSRSSWSSTMQRTRSPPR